MRMLQEYSHSKYQLQLALQFTLRFLDSNYVSLGVRASNLATSKTTLQTAPLRNKSVGTNDFKRRY